MSQHCIACGTKYSRSESSVCSNDFYVWIQFVCLLNKVQLYILYLFRFSVILTKCTKFSTTSCTISLILNFFPRKFQGLILFVQTYMISSKIDWSRLEQDSQKCLETYCTDVCGKQNFCCKHSLHGKIGHSPGLSVSSQQILKCHTFQNCS